MRVLAGDGAVSVRHTALLPPLAVCAAEQGDPRAAASLAYQVMRA